ncbi:MAG: replication-associated recombination protein A [Proteobacteria bacterium]|nr:replication-associated recombination protein A [Pseudomonadota bacterium]MBU1716287.1 replication-associated recombination protein A [Pseudomonadota bacterium]
MTMNNKSSIPLAERMRPKSIDKFVGQEHLLGEGKLLNRLMNEHHIPSLIFWGPPGTGKTTLARILAENAKAEFVFFSAVLSGVKEVRKIVATAEELRKKKNLDTILFVDEIHRFNRSQQDSFLPHVESGLLTLIGATTENPSFQVIAPLLSRCRVLVLNPLTSDNLKQILISTLHDQENGFQKLDIQIEKTALDHLADTSDGDARSALNSLEIAVSLTPTNKDGKIIIELQNIEEAIQRKSLRYDAYGEEHYNLISALHKSLRDSDPDGSLYWLTRMLMAGEDPLYLARRLIRFASEDIGNADPQALGLTISARESYHTLGSPEGELALAQAVIYLATAPKSNATYVAYSDAKKLINNTGTLPVPKHLRNAPTNLMKKLDYGKGYKYAHDQPDAVVMQDHLPPELKGKKFYHPTNRGHEAIIKDRLNKWHKILAERKSLLPRSKQNDK